MPVAFTYGLIVICVAPFLLGTMGVSFASSPVLFDLEAAAQWPKHQQLDAFFYRLTGAFNHTLLEWSAFCAAIFTVCLAFSHYAISKDVTTPVIGAALFLAGCMDAFHTLAADRLIEAVADNRNLVPFTWAICRIFNGIILVGGVTLLLYRKEDKHSGTNLKVLFAGFAASTVVAYSIIHYCAVSAELPQTQYPGSLITRPYDVIPLVIFILAGLFLFPYFYKKRPSVFAHALILAMIPEAVVELHMAFGSSQLFDHHFNIAHFLKIIAYIVPFCGLLMDYIHTYQSKEIEIEERKRIEDKLRLHTQELKRSNEDLDKFAYIASHDLKAPLRGIDHLTTWIEEDKHDPEALDKHFPLMHMRISRMEKLMDDLLRYSRIGREEEAVSEVDISAMIDEIFDMASAPAGFSLTKKGEVSAFDAELIPLQTVVRNLVGNAIKHHEGETGNIVVLVEEKASDIFIHVADDGPGIGEEFYHKIFEVFQTLKPRDSVEGSGIGLALVKKIVDTQGGSIEVSSRVGKGTTMTVRWPKLVSYDLSERVA